MVELGELTPARDAFDPVHATRVAVERYAESVRQKLGFKPGDDILELVEQLGGEVLYEDLHNWRDDTGAICVFGPRHFQIWLPTYTSGRRDRFTIAHELGHYFLHSRQGEIPLRATRMGRCDTPRAEWEANWFAAALLMPEGPFRETWEARRSLSALADRFVVSHDAARVRKEVLGLDG